MMPLDYLAFPFLIAFGDGEHERAGLDFGATLSQVKKVAMRQRRDPKAALAGQQQESFRRQPEHGLTQRASADVVALANVFKPHWHARRKDPGKQIAAHPFVNRLGQRLRPHGRSQKSEPRTARP